MQILTDTAAILQAARTHPDPQLRHLLTQRIASLADYADLELLQVLVLEKDETSAEMALGCGLPQVRLIPELIETHDHWCELTFVTSQDGSGIVVFVPASAHELLAGFGQTLTHPTDTSS